MTQINLSKVVRRYLLLFSFAMAIYNPCDAQGWQNVGNPGFSSGAAGYPTLAIDSKGTLYTAYEGDAHKATVMKYDGSNWVTVGNAGFSAGAIAFQPVSIAIGKNDTPFVAYIDNVDDLNLIVMKYDGNNWVKVGGDGVVGVPTGADFDGSSFSFALDTSGTPYISYDISGGSLVVEKFNGNNWDTLGNTYESDNGPISLTVRNDTPYIAFPEANIPNHYFRGTVMKYDGSHWVVIGSPAFTNYIISSPSLVIDSSGTPYLAFKDDGSGKANVMKFDGNNWINVGSANFSTNGADFINIAIDRNGTPYVAYVEDSFSVGNGTSTQTAAVKKYNGSSWGDVGTTFPKNGSAFISIAIDSSNTPYVVFDDDPLNGKATAMKYENNTSVPNQSTYSNGFAVVSYPNPTTDKITIAYDAHNIAATSLSIINVTGQTVLTQKLGDKQSGIVTIPINQLSAGIYLLQLNSGTETVRQKFVKQ